MGTSVGLKKALQEVEVTLKKAAEGIPKAKRDERRDHMKATMPMMGLTVPQQRAVAKSGYSFSGCGFEEQFPIWNHVWFNASTHEAKMQAVYFVGRRKDLPATEEMWHRLRPWAEDINCWDQSDELSKIYSFLFEDKPGLVYPQLKQWNVDNDPWRRRQSIVSLFCYSKIHEKHPPVKKVLPLVQSLLEDEDYYVQKGVGWTLRETYNVYPSEAFDFVLKNIARIQPAAFSASIEKMSAQEKKTIKDRRKVERKKA